MKSIVVHHEQVPSQQLDNKVSRRVLAHLPEQMIVEVSFETGGVGTPHTHPHIQSTYVVSGEFVFTVEGQQCAVRQGDTIAFASGEVHGCVCTAAGVLVDVFTPMREDFLALK